MGKKIVVFGSYITDFTSRTPSFPVPGETIIGSGFKMGPGGKASNQCIAATKAGADAMFVTKLGKDTFGDYARDYYLQQGFSTEGFLYGDGAMTGAATITVNEKTGENMIVVVPGISLAYTAADMDFVKEKVKAADYLLIQLEVSMYATKSIIQFAHENNIKIIFNPAPAVPLDVALLSKIRIITPNETEASILTGIAVTEAEESVRAAANKLHEMGIPQVIITLGEKGAFASDGATSKFFPALQGIKVVDTTGAGDAFNGGFAAALAGGKSFFDAIQYGIALSGLSVTKEGTAPSMPSQAEIEQVYQTLV
ncbi:MAG: ribokinase [Christensenellaceae bacterium]|jgi:ribokinase